MEVTKEGLPEEESQRQRFTGDRLGAPGAAGDTRHVRRSFLMLDLKAPDVSPSSRMVYSVDLTEEATTKQHLLSQPSGICCHNQVTESLPWPCGLFPTWKGTLPQ